MFIKQVIKGPALTRFRNSLLVRNELVRNESRYQWGLGEPEDVCSDHFWLFFKTNSLVCNGDGITPKYRCIDLDRDLWFMMGMLMRKKRCNLLNENIYYVSNDNQKPSLLSFSSTLNE